MGGNSPQSLVNETSLAIQRGELDIAILTGGEAWHSRSRSRKAGDRAELAESPSRRVSACVRRRPGDESPRRARARGRDAGADLPDVRDRDSCGSATNRRRTPVLASELWSRFSDVAAQNPFAWSATAEDAPRDPHTTERQPHDRFPVYEVHEFEQQRRYGCGTDHVQRRRHRRWESPAIGGCSPSRAPTATSTTTSAIGGASPRHQRSSSVGAAPASWPASASTTSTSSISTRAFRRRCNSARRASALASTVSSPARAACRSPAGRGTTTSCTRSRRSCADLRDGPGATRVRVGERRLRDEALVRRVRHHSPGRRFQHELPAGRSRRDAAARARRPRRRCGRRRRSRRTPSCSLATASPSTRSPRACWPTADEHGVRAAIRAWSRHVRGRVGRPGRQHSMPKARSTHET